MTLNKDGSIAGYEIKEPFEPKKRRPKKHSNLLNNRRKDIESQRKKAAEKMNEIQQTFKK